MKTYQSHVSVVIALGMALIVLPAFAGTNTALPFTDDFESYPENTPLIDGTNGWYASSSNAIVQTNVVYDGTNAAMVPDDVTLSNRFSGIGTTNIWLQMDVHPVLSDSEDFPEIDANVTAMFYVDNNGYFVVHNGTPTNWCTLTNTVTGTNATLVSADDWVRLNIYQNYSNHTWTLFANYKLMWDDIGFVNTNDDTFNGFNFYNGGGNTSYLDGVLVEATLPTDLGNDGGDWLPDVKVNLTDLTSLIFTGQVASSQQFELWKTNGYYSLVFTNSVNQDWLSVGPSSGTNTGAYATVDVTYATSGLGAQAAPYQATINVAGEDSKFGFTCTNSPQTISVSVYVQDMSVAPSSLSNMVMEGNSAPNQTFDVISSGGGTINYTVTTNGVATWLSVLPDSGSLTDADSDTITVSYTTAGLTPGSYNETLKVISTEGGGATQEVSVVMDVMALSVAPAGLTNLVMEGNSAPNQTFDIISTGSGTCNYTVTTNGVATWLSVLPDSGSLTDADSDTITVSYTTAGLTPGSYNETLKVISTEGGGATSSVDVAFTVIESNRPAVFMSSTASDPTHEKPIPVTVTFSENVTGFEASDIVPGSAEVANFTTVSPSNYTFNLVPTTENGTVTADIPENVAYDDAENGNTPAEQFSIVYQGIPLPVSGLSATDGGVRLIGLTWNSSENTLRYNVWRGTSSDTNLAETAPPS